MMVSIAFTDEELVQLRCALEYAYSIASSPTNAMRSTQLKVRASMPPAAKGRKRCRSCAMEMDAAVEKCGNCWGRRFREYEAPIYTGEPQ